MTDLTDPARANGFHAQTGWYFARLPYGAVRITVRDPVKGYEWAQTDLPADSWASIVASMCGVGETAETWQRAREFHQAGEVTDMTLARHHRECEMSADALAVAAHSFMDALDHTTEVLNARDRLLDAIEQWNHHQWPKETSDG